MNFPGAPQIADYLWTAMGIYWVASARQSAKTKTTEPHVFRALRFGILGLTFVLLLTPWLRFGFLGERFVAENAALEWFGIAVTLAGLATTVWARICLGSNWSDKVVIKEDHELIRSGPYAWMRHPIYSGVLLGIAGTALVIGEWRCVAAFCILLVNYSIKAKKEERVLQAAFGDAFQRHLQQTGFLLPRLRIGAR